MISANTGPSIRSLLSTTFLLLCFTLSMSYNIISPPYYQQISLTQEQSYFYIIDLSGFQEGQILSIATDSLSNQSLNVFLSKSITLPSAPATSDYSVYDSLTGGVITIPSSDITSTEALFLGLVCNLKICNSELTVALLKESTKTITSNNEKLSKESEVLSAEGSSSEGEGQITIGSLLPGEQIHKQFTAQVNGTGKIIFELNTASNINISIKNCRNTRECKDLVIPGIDQSNIMNLYSDADVAQFEYNITTTGTGKQVVLDLYGNGCYPLIYLPAVGFSQGICGYIVTLTSYDDEPAIYSLTSNSFDHQELLLGVPHEDIIQKDEWKYFVINIEHSKIKQLSFQSSASQGEIIFYVSTTEEFPSQQSNLANIASKDKIVFSGDELNNIYYIAVRGVQMSSFTLNITATNEAEMLEDYALELKDGVSQSGALRPKQGVSSLYYKYYLNSSEDADSNLKIFVIPVRGAVFFAVNTIEGVMPNLYQDQWVSRNNYRYIRPIEEGYRSNGYYYIGIFVAWDDVNTYLYDDIPFTVTVAK